LNALYKEAHYNSVPPFYFYIVLSDTSICSIMPFMVVRLQQK
jgi:hypothetical protein